MNESTYPLVLSTDLEGLPPPRRGKVRDIYDLGDTVLLVASDRISAFDVVLPTGIPSKGAVLTQISAFWFGQMANIIPNHLISVNIEDFPVELRRYRDVLGGRSTLGRKTSPIPIECIARGYLTGSVWAEYRRNGTIAGNAAPTGLLESIELPRPIFTPTTKAETDHDAPMSFEDVTNSVGLERANALRETTLRVYETARIFARERGIVIADTKLEFGVCDDELILIDELLTPDSSRFWPMDSFAVGRSQPSFDKQPVRDYLEATGWDKQPPAPPLPPDVVDQTSQKYREVYQMLVGRALE